MKNIKDYYFSIRADDNYIYVLYLGEETDNHPSAKLKYPHLVFIFDWGGNLIKKLDIGHPVREITIDDKHNLLYAMDMEDDKLYCLDLNQLNLK